MKRLLPALLVLVVFGFGLAACRGPLESEGAAAPRAAAPAIAWNGASDKAMAVNIDATASLRSNASGPKIASNAQSSEFPGILFIWDSKQSDNGYLKVKASLFDTYESFTLTAKESNSYWDFLIKPQTGQMQTADGCYVYFIPKSNNNKNINMVFVGDYRLLKDVFPPISFLPDPSSFTKEMVNLPNPFISWDGYRVTSSNWPSRRTEISQIMQHYMFGYKLPTKDAEPGKRVFTELTNITAGAAGAARTMTFTVTREETGTSTTFTSTIYLPSGTPPEGGWPVLLGIGSGSWASINAAGYARINYAQGQVDATDKGGDTDSTPIVRGAPNAAGTRNDVVIRLFPETNRFSGIPGPNAQFNNEEYRHPTSDYDWVSDYGDLDAPGCFMNWAWGISLIIDAMEAQNLKPEAERLVYLNPLRFGIIGVSRNGKTALLAAAMDVRIAGAAPMSTCAGGLNIDRFVSVAVNEADSRKNYRQEGAIGRPNQTLLYTDFTYTAANGTPSSTPSNRPAGQTSTSWAPYNLAKTEGFGPFDGYGYVNKYFQYLKWDDALYVGNYRSPRVVTAEEALIDPTRDLNGGFPVEQSWPTGEMAIVWKSNFPTMTNLKDGYGVMRYTISFTPTENAAPSGGIQRPWAPQPAPDHRWRYPTSYSSRYFQMPLIYNHLNVHTRDHAGDWGYFANAPYDMHFLSALVAPRVLLMCGGIQDANGGHETVFMNYLASREVYRLLGAEKSVGIVAYTHGHAGVEQEGLDFIEMMNAAYEGRSPNSRLTPDSVDTYPYPINDPRSRYDYVKLNWAAPGYEPIANQVKRLVPENYSY